MMPAGILQTKLAESGKRNLGSPSQDKKDVIFLRTTLNAARALLRMARAELREFDSKGGSREWAGGIVAHIDAAYKHIDSLLTKKGNLVVNVSTQELVASKKSKKETAEAVTDTDDLPVQPLRKPIARDASTDTILTPSWWDSDKVTESKLASRRRPLRQTSGATKQRVQTQDTDNDSTMETDAVNWSTVVRRPPKTKEPAATETSTSAPTALTKRGSVGKKPSVILIRPGDGKNYTDTVRTVRGCGLTSQDLGASITMRETGDGSLLLELAKGANSSVATKSIAVALSTRLGDCWESYPTWRSGRG